MTDKPLHDWKYDENGNETPLYARLIEALRILLFDSQGNLFDEPNGVARMIVSQLAFKHDFAPLNLVLEDGQEDWTSIGTRANSSTLYIYCAETVELILRREQRNLTSRNGRERAAHEIILQLGGRYQLVPTTSVTEVETTDES
jgi:hypothetical protein